MLRGILDNVLSGMKAGFKAILNLFKHPNGESRMFNLTDVTQRDIRLN